VGVLGQVLRAGVGVGADVEEDQRSGRGDHLDGQRRPVHAGRAAEPQDRGRHARPGVPGADDGVGAAPLDELAGDEDRGVLLVAEGPRRMLVHLDDLAGGLDGHVAGQAARGEGRDPVRVADQDQLVVGCLAGVEQRAGHDLHGGMVAAHRVDRDADPAPMLDAPNGGEVHRVDALAGRGRGGQEAASPPFFLSSTACRPS